ncbi:MAG: 30S ribosomal protein S12 methylthiotransferase RimO [Gemmatimonadetes bacterium]|nr:MAG: 30S ribosomal protein S12 methylthiotransferase RimO [Gemmatimonadota bacterium]
MSGRTRALPVFPIAPEPVRPGVPADIEAVRLELDALGPEDGPRIGLITLGCDKNTVDSEKMMAALVGHGARVSSDLEGVDVVVVNTCGFIDAAKEQSIETILEACQLKERGDVAAVVAVGCMVERYKQELAAEIPEVDLFLGLAEMGSLIDELRARGYLPEPEAVPLMERPLRVLATETRHTSYLKISEGCDHSCAFCAIPTFRGLHRSAPLDELVREAQALERQGVREINIVSQDTTWYGRDLRRRDPEAPLLPDLLRALVRETGVPWYRLFYMYPSGITRELVELIAAEPQLLPYLDMPLQHGSDRILAAMRRPERRATILERVRWLREAVPDLTLRTTVIVGFPGETEDDFRALLDLLEEVRFDRVGVFAYSPEDGTLAASMPDSVPPSLKRERLEQVLDVQRGLAVERNLELVGRTFDALVDEPLHDDPDHEALARTVGQAADVDGVTYLTDAAGAGRGSLVRVRIEDVLEYDLVGRVVEVLDGGVAGGGSAAGAVEETS